VDEADKFVDGIVTEWHQLAIRRLPLALNVSHYYYEKNAWIA
jgi:hypothetical protein